MNQAARLQSWIAEIIKNYNTHTTLADTCSVFGMAVGIPDDQGSKFERVLARLSGKSEREIATIAEKVGVHYGVMELEEAALAVLEDGSAPLTEITRRDVARCLNLVGLSGELDLIDLIGRIWPIQRMGNPFLFGNCLADEIRQHMIRNLIIRLTHLQ